MSNFEEKINIEEPETIFDLEPDELDVLIQFRKLSSDKQKKIVEYIKEKIKTE